MPAYGFCRPLTKQILFSAALSLTFRGYEGGLFHAYRVITSCGLQGYHYDFNLPGTLNIISRSVIEQLESSFDLIFLQFPTKLTWGRTHSSWRNSPALSDIFSVAVFLTVNWFSVTDTFIQRLFK